MSTFSWWSKLKSNQTRLPKSFVEDGDEMTILCKKGYLKVVDLGGGNYELQTDLTSGSIFIAEFVSNPDEWLKPSEDKLKIKWDISPDKYVSASNSDFLLNGTAKSFNLEYINGNNHDGFLRNGQIFNLLNGTDIMEIDNVDEFIILTEKWMDIGSGCATYDPSLTGISSFVENIIEELDSEDFSDVWGFQTEPECNDDDQVCESRKECCENDSCADYDDCYIECSCTCPVGYTCDPTTKKCILIPVDPWWKRMFTPGDIYFWIMIAVVGVLLLIGIGLLIWWYNKKQKEE